MKKLLLLSVLALAFTYTSKSFAMPAGGTCIWVSEEPTEQVFAVNNCSSSSTTVYWSISGRSYSISKTKFTPMGAGYRLKTVTSCERVGTKFQIRQINTEQFKECEEDLGGGTGYRYPIY